MAQVTAVQQVHRQDRIARVDDVISGIVGRCAGKRLDIHMDLVSRDAVIRKDFRAAAAGQSFEDIHIFHALIIARIGIAAEIPEAVIQIQDLFLAHFAGRLIRITFRIDILKYGTE